MKPKWLTQVLGIMDSIQQTVDAVIGFSLAGLNAADRDRVLVSAPDVDVEDLIDQIQESARRRGGSTTPGHSAGSVADDCLKPAEIKHAVKAQIDFNQSVVHSLRLIAQHLVAIEERLQDTEQKMNRELDEIKMKLLRAERIIRAISSADAVRSAPEHANGLAEGRPLEPIHPTNELTGSGATASSVTTNPLHRPFDYFMFENRFRGTISEVKCRQSVYLDLFLDRENVLDLGCGQGEFVELLSENGVNVIGVDSNEDMVEFCRDRGLRVMHADLFYYLGGLPDESLDGVFVSQVVEHLSPEQIVTLIGLCGKKLKPGGVAVAETVNINCPVALSNFYLDPTHVRPVPAKLLWFMFEQGPFKVQSLRFSSPVSGRGASEVLDVSGAASDLPQEVSLYQDYAVVAVRGLSCEEGEGQGD